ncbi:MAG: DUF885 domain-containing protein [Candidatus Zixiibacteriota bacterium]
MYRTHSRFVEECRKLASGVPGLLDRERLHKIFELEWSYRMAENPMSATYEGYPGYNHVWPNLSIDNIERHKTDWRHWRSALATVDPGQLTPEDKLSYDLFEYYLNDGFEGARFPAELLAISQMDGVHHWVPDILNIMPLSTDSQRDDILNRLDKVPALIDQVITLLGEGIKRQITHPGPVIADTSQQIKNLLTENPADSPILAVLKKLPTATEPAVREKLTRQAESLYIGKVKPSFERLLNYVAHTYLPACRKSIGLSELPDGRAWYEHLVRSFTTTQFSPDDIFAIGEDEVARIRSEMDKVIASSGFKGNFEQFTEFLRTDPQFYFDKKEDLVKEYRDISKRADPELASLFGRLPALPYGVAVIPSYAEKSQTTAFYQPGSPDAGRPGYYYVNTYDLGSRPKWEMEALTLHEAVPGHHLQIALSQELTDLPQFRARGWITAYGEGWALYAESLGEQMGFYTNPYSKFGQLTYEMWRAIRLVVDTGMHWKGWTRQQAIDYMMANSGKTGHDVQVEIDRYIVWPGQSLAYKIGELKIKELRRHAEEALGDKMSLRDFHDQLLCHGSMPLSVLEKRLKAWVAEK